MTSSIASDSEYSESECFYSVSDDDGRCYGDNELFYSCEKPDVQLPALESSKYIKKSTIEFIKFINKDMGFFSKGSAKKHIFEICINRLEAKYPSKFLSEEFISNELGYFIFIAVMNRFNNDKTSSGKSCLKLLNDPRYEPLKKILFPNIHKALRYENLLNLVSQVGSQQYKLTTSKRCLEKLVRVFFKIHTNPHKEFNSSEAWRNSLQEILVKNAV